MMEDINIGKDTVIGTVTTKAIGFGISYGLPSWI